ncbi:MAG TPA: isochorismatase family protein [Chitinophagales bacterium]|nr:isochorismatase family protein [Chitinophagales bacterium]
MITTLDPTTALVLIDLQKMIVSRQTVHPVETILHNAGKLLDAFHEKSAPVVIVKVDPSKFATSTARKDAKMPAMVIGNDFMDTAPGLKTKPDDILIIKYTWNAFYGTQLHNELQKRNVTGIVLAGISTSIGVEGTARAASEHGYNIAFALDAMTDPVAEAHAHSMKYIFPRIGESGTTDEIIAKL